MKYAAVCESLSISEIILDWDKLIKGKNEMHYKEANKVGSGEGVECHSETLT